MNEQIPSASISQLNRLLFWNVGENLPHRQSTLAPHRQGFWPDWPALFPASRIWPSLNSRTRSLS